MLAAAGRDIMALQDAELEAIQKGASLDGFDAALDLARSKRDRIKREFLIHVRKQAADRCHTSGPCTTPHGGAEGPRQRGHCRCAMPAKGRLAQSGR